MGLRDLRKSAGSPGMGAKKGLVKEDHQATNVKKYQL